MRKYESLRENFRERARYGFEHERVIVDVRELCMLFVVQACAKAAIFIDAPYIAILLHVRETEKFSQFIRPSSCVQSSQGRREIRR